MNGWWLAVVALAMVGAVVIALGVTSFVMDDRKNGREKDSDERDARMEHELALARIEAECFTKAQEQPPRSVFQSRGTAVPDLVGRSFLQGVAADKGWAVPVDVGFIESDTADAEEDQERDEPYPLAPDPGSHALPRERRPIRDNPQA